MNDQLVTLSTYLYPVDAELDRSRLEVEGIESAVLDENVANLNWAYALAAGGIRLQVRQSDAARAAEVLGLTQGGETPPTVQHTATRQCPYCESTNIRLNTSRFPRVMALAAFFALIGVLPLFLRKHWECRDCGRSWKSR